MTILFDIFIQIPELGEELKPNERAVFDEIVTFFEQRLMPLDEEIERQEAANTEKNSCTIIHLLPPKEELGLPKEQQSQKIRVSCHGYTKELKEKMENSFNNNDFIMLNNKLEAIDQMWNN